MPIPPGARLLFSPRLRPPLVGGFSFLLRSHRSAIVPVMPDDDKLTPASSRDVEICLSLGLTSGRALARSQAAEVTAKVVAERLVAIWRRPAS